MLVLLCCCPIWRLCSSSTSASSGATEGDRCICINRCLVARCDPLNRRRPIWVKVVTDPRRQSGSGPCSNVFGPHFGRFPDQGEGRSRLSEDNVVLTQRQLEILHLLAQGKTTGEITSELGLSRTTVRNHVANLLAALGAHSRLQAVLIARRAGILEM